MDESVHKAMNKVGRDELSLADCAALASEEASTYLETLAQASHAITRQRFGKAIKLYAPIYVSNECVNNCLYCGFSASNPIERRVLSVDEVLEEAEAIISRGHRHILMVSGEDPKKTPVKYHCDIARALRGRVAGLTIEGQPFTRHEYEMLADAGVDGVTLYQETYDRETYTRMHPKGPKSDFEKRLAAIDDAAAAGMRFIGIGALFGLYDWRQEVIAIISHARRLMKSHWKAFVTVSLPRIRDARAGFKMPSPVSDRELAQAICVLRTALPDCGITLSTREDATLRDKLIPLGITQMSAGSVTMPGGYTKGERAGAQFAIEDRRSPQDVAAALTKLGYDPVWKDWDIAFRR